MKGRFAAVAVIIAVVGCATIDSTKEREAWWTLRAEADIKAGTSKDNVEAFLVARKITFSYVPRDNAFYILERTSSELLITTDVWVRIYFTEESVVKHTEIEHVHTSL